MRAKVAEGQTEVQTATEKSNLTDRPPASQEYPAECARSCFRTERPEPEAEKRQCARSYSTPACMAVKAERAGHGAGSWCRCVSEACPTVGRRTAGRMDVGTGRRRWRCNDEPSPVAMTPPCCTDGTVRRCHRTTATSLPQPVHYLLDTPVFAPPGSILPNKYKSTTVFRILSVHFICNFQFYCGVLDLIL